jgi:hypothetical protein
MGWITNKSGFDSQWEQEIFLFSIISRLAVGPTLPPVLGVFLPLVLKLRMVQ